MKHTSILVLWAAIGRSLFTTANILSTLLFVLLGFAPATLHAQLVADGGTLNLNYYTNLYPLDLIVGTNGGNTTLNITAPSTVSNARGYVGYDASSTNNVVTVHDGGASWNSSGTLAVGNSGSGNQLVVSNGATAFSDGGFVGSNPGATNNRAVIAGANSLWNCGNSVALAVGNSGSGNQLVVNDGAMISSGNSSLGENSTANNNSAMITGANSQWNTYTLLIGKSGGGNQLVVSNGAAISSGNSSLGENSTGDNNRAVITGTTSQWNCGITFTIGDQGSGNQLVVSNAGTLFVWDSDVDEYDGIGILGNQSGANDNVARVTGAGSLWTILGDLTVGLNGTGNQLIVSGGAAVDNGNAKIGDNSANNLVFVTGAGSGWTNGALSVGNSGSYNQVVVSNSAVLRSTIGLVGNLGGAWYNTARVTGASALWANSGDLYVGSAGSYNQLVVSSGATVRNLTGRVGGQSFADYNTAQVTGAGSLWTNNGDLYIGDSGGHNDLTVSAGAVVRNIIGRIGSQYTSSFNTATVDGSGSLWTNSGDLFVGESGSDSQLTVTGGGTVVAKNLTLGFDTFYSSGNSVTVNGGTLRLTSGAGAGTLDIRRGTLELDSGSVTATTLLATNGSASPIVFNGGTLSAGAATVSNSQPLVVGGTFSSARYELLGNGLHTFADGLFIANHTTLTNSGGTGASINGPVTVQNGGKIDLTDAGPDTLTLNVSPILQGNLAMQVIKTDAGSSIAKAQDQISVTGASLTYGGTLTVTRGDVANTNLTVNDSFKLFNAISYAGSFSAISLPPVNPGAMWKNLLLASGTILVVAQTPPTISGITQSGANLVFNVTGGSPGGGYTLLTATNVALPLANWTTNSTGNFDWMGNLTLTNAIDSATPQRLFTVRAP